MINSLIRLALALLVLNILFTPADAWGRYGGKSSSNHNYGKVSNNPNKPMTFTGTSLGLPSQFATRRGLGISAWGIIVLIVALILAGVGVYYFSICYSVCKTNKSKYDKMGMPVIA